MTERDSWIRRLYSGFRWYDGWLRSAGTGFRQSLLRSRRVQPPPDQGPFAFGPSYVLQWISPSDLLGLWRAVFTERQTRWQFELVKRCSGRPWCVRKTKLLYPSQHTHARSGLYRSLRYPILMRTALVSARKHENLEDLFVSLFSLFEYISRSFSRRCSFVPGVARSQWSIVLVLVCLPACGLHEIGSVSVFVFFFVRKSLLVDLLGDDFRSASVFGAFEESQTASTW